MATINFPANPQLNDTYTFLGRTWIYNGIGWVVKPDDITAFVNKGGDTMSGKLTITSGGLSVSGTTSLEAIETSSQTLVDNLNADFLDGQEGAFYRNASNLNAGTLALLYGGTGSTTAAGARTNLGAAALAGSSTQDFSTQNLTVSGTTYNMLTLSRTTANGASILFQNSSGNLGKLGFDGSGNLIVGKGTTTDGVADLLKITPAGVTTFYDSVTASSFIKSGGTSSQFLKADGTVDSNAYLPLSGGILTGYLEINTPNTGGSSFLRFKRNGVNVGYVGDGASGANTEIELSNYISGKSLSLGNDGILRYGGNVVWHQGNDGTNSGLDADTLDTFHAKVNGGGGEAWGYIPVVATDGTMQVGRYLDFNHSSGIGADYNARLHTNGVTDGELYINSNRIWHAGNFNPSNYLPLTGGNVTGNTTIKGGTNVFEYTLRLAKGNYADTGGHTTLIGFGVETIGWSKSAIGHTRTGSYDRGYLGFYINNSIDTTSATSSDLKMSIDSSGLVWSNGGFSKQGSSDSYVLLGAGGHKLISDFTDDDRNKGVNNVTTLASLPISKRLIYATVTAATSISLSSAMEVGSELHIVVYNSSAAAVTQVLPNTGAFISMSGSSVSIPSVGHVEINILCHATGSYIIRAGGVSW